MIYIYIYNNIYKIQKISFKRFKTLFYKIRNYLLDFFLKFFGSVFFNFILSHIRETNFIHKYEFDIFISFGERSIEKRIGLCKNVFCHRGQLISFHVTVSSKLEILIVLGNVYAGIHPFLFFLFKPNNSLFLPKKARRIYFHSKKK